MSRTKNHVKAVLSTRTQKQADSCTSRFYKASQWKNKDVSLALRYMQL